MNLIRKFFDYLARHDQRLKQEYEEAYLAKSANIYELEYRLRELDNKKSFHPWAGFTQQ